MNLISLIGGHDSISYERMSTLGVGAGFEVVKIKNIKHFGGIGVLFYKSCLEEQVLLS